MFRHLFMLFCTMGLTLYAGVSDGAETITIEKTGEVAGTAGLDVAVKKCAPLEGTREWQTCVAHYDGLYTKRDGIILRSYKLSADAPVPTGQIEKCHIKATFDKKTGTWNYSSCTTANIRGEFTNE